MYSSKEFVLVWGKNIETYNAITPNQNFRQVVYLAVNTINKKLYVGETKRRVGDRIFHHYYYALHQKKYGQGFLFRAAIIKYGWQAFEWYVLEEVKELKDLKRREGYHIHRLNTLVSGNGYNLRWWDDDKGTVSEETREKLRELALSDPTNYIKSLTIDDRKYNAWLQHHANPNAHQIHSPTRSVDLKYKWTDEQRLKLSVSLKGKKLSDTHKLNISKGCKDFFIEHPEVKEKMGANHRSKTQPPESLKHTEEAKAKIRERCRSPILCENIKTGQSFVVSGTRNACAQTGVSRTTINRLLDAPTKKIKVDWRFKRIEQKYDPKLGLARKIQD